MFHGVLFSLMFMPTQPNASFTQKFQNGGRTPEVVITLWPKTISIKVILAAGSMFYACRPYSHWDCVDICYVADLLILPVLGTVSTSGLPLILLPEVGRCRWQWLWIQRALKHCLSRWDFLDIVSVAKLSRNFRHLGISGLKKRRMRLAYTSVKNWSQKHRYSQWDCVDICFFGFCC